MVRHAFIAMKRVQVCPENVSQLCSIELYDDTASNECIFNLATISHLCTPQFPETGKFCT